MYLYTQYNFIQSYEKKGSWLYTTMLINLNIMGCKWHKIKLLYDSTHEINNKQIHRKRKQNSILWEYEKELV